MNNVSVYNGKGNEIISTLVYENEKGVDIATSLIVAQVFGKEHNKVCRDIENLSCSTSFRDANFGETPYVHPQNGQTYKMYTMTKDGFSFLVMGYTGAKAGEFKERFINEFNRREALLKDDDYILMRSQQILQKRIEIAEQKIKQLEDKNARQEPLVSFAQTAFKAEGKVDIGQAAKILGLPFGRNTLFKKLKEKGILFKRNEPKQKYVDAGYFELTQLPPIHRNNHPDIIVMKVLCTQKGLAYINHLFGGSKSDGKLAKIV